MARYSIIWGVLAMGCAVQALAATSEDNPPEYMSREERESLKEEARDMFYHAYNAYMDNAYPADELMPLSCKGRYRGSEPDRGDIDSTLGNFSLTLVDTLDTLVVLGDLEEFENAVRLVVEDVKFDTDVIVSLFETNIRMLGGLLSGHILAEYLQLRADIMPWYRGELLDLAKDLGYRFLPAFNTTTGIPFGRINLRHGMKGVPAEMCRETCTACAGSMILEMAALSRLTGESIFEEKAQKAMDALWKMRHRGTDLMGSVLNVHSGDWVRRDSGVGAGIDSYYEYCLKAYILLGDEKYLGRFNKHYQAVMKYVSQGPMLLDVHMHRPNTNSKNFMDALLAFWPGLQVLKGDIKPAVETHEMLYQVMQRHNFIPEAFTTDFQVHWGHHPLRPEFLESTYFLYRATGDHYYLGVGRKVLKSLQTYARVTCGYAAVSDVRTNKHDDTMDSFVLSETFKYLFLLFAEPNDLVLDLDEFIFTTEGHLLPLTLAAVRTNVTTDLDRDIVQVEELDRTCPNSLHLFPASVRQPLRNMVEDVCPRRSLKRRLNASQFQANNLEHLKILGNMGITILTLADGRVQLLHTFSNARTAQDAEEGLLFMQEMVELSRKQSQQSETRPQFVAYIRNDMTPPQEVTLLAGPAHFGPGFKDGNRITGNVEFASPSEACSELVEPKKLVGKVVVVARGNCMFVEKARRIQKAGAIAGIVLDTVVGSSASVSPMFAMSGDGKEPDDVTIPVVFLFNKEATELVVSHMANDGLLTVTLGDFPRDEVQLKAPGDLSVFERLKGSLKDFLVRQITSQNAGSTSRPVGAPAATEVEGDTGEAIPVEYAHLKALIYKDMGVVKIEKPGPAAFTTRSSSQTLNNFEKMWYTMKQDLVNIIYSSSKPTFMVIAKVQFQYKMVHKLRGLDNIPPVEQLSLWLLIRWLLKELSEVQPDQFARFKDYSADGEKSFEHSSLEELIEKTDSSERANLMEVNTESLLRLVAESIQWRKDILRNMAANEALQESMSHIIHSDSPDFKQSASAAGTKAEKDGKDNDAGDKIEGEVGLVSWRFYAHLRAIIYKDRGVVEFGKFDVDPGEIIPPTSLDEVEQTWYEQKKLFLNFMYSRCEPSLEITAEILKQYCLEHMRRDPNNRAAGESIEDTAMWLLKELSQVQPDPTEIGFYVLQRMRQEFRAPFDRELIRKRFAEELTALDIRFPNFYRDLNSDYIQTEVEEAVKVWTSEEAEKSDNVDAEKCDNTDVEVASGDERERNVVSYGHLKATIFEDEGLVKFGMTDVEPPEYSEAVLNSRSNRAWNGLLQMHINYMYSRTKPFVEIPIEFVRFHYLLTQRRVRNYRETSEKLEDMIRWFLKELSRFRPDPEAVGFFVLNRIRQEFKEPFDRKLIRERFGEELIALEINFYNFFRDMDEEYLLRQVDAAVSDWTSEKTKRSKNAASDEDENAVMKDDNISNQKTISTGDTQAKKPGNQDENNTTNDKSKYTAEFSYIDESPSKEESNRNNVEQVRSAAGDSLEGLKKPVWAPEEEKKSSKSFSRLEEKPETSDARLDTADKRNFEYLSEYTKSNREAKTRRSEKHINDEL